VAFNKVVTAQYFIWYLALLPLVLPHTRIRLKYRGIQLIALFLAAEVAWGIAAYQIEFVGRATFLWVWFAGVVFFGVQILTLVVFIQNHTTPATTPAPAAKAKLK